MHLTKLRLRNVRALVNVELECDPHITAIVGRNNSGKSTVLEALKALRECFSGEGNTDWENIVRNKDPRNTLHLGMEFRLATDERATLLDELREGVRRHRPPDEGRFPDLATRDTAFARSFAIGFDSEGAASAPLLGSLTILAPNGKLVPVVLKGRHTNLVASFVNQPEPPSIELLDVRKVPSVGYDRQKPVTGNLPSDPVIRWLLAAVGTWLANTRFFSPFREATPAAMPEYAAVLAENGANLAQVLNFLRSNKPSQFAAVKSALLRVLPELGDLVTPIATDNSIYAAFQEGEFEVRLKEMGGGVQQLLMILTVLATTPETTTLLIDEPECHLHPGAQRALLGELLNSPRTAILTTHSPVFLDQRATAFVMRPGAQSAKAIGGRLRTALAELGSRPSDVLMSDAVVFVEGPSDADVLTGLARRLAVDLQHRNVTIRYMDGGFAAPSVLDARLRALEAVAQENVVPCLMIFDGDERSQAERSRLTERGDVVVLSRREIENYLLNAGAIRQWLRSKYEDDAEILVNVGTVTDAEIDEMIDHATANLKAHVLVRRLRAEIGILSGGLITRDDLEQLEAIAPESDEALAHAITSRVEGRLKQQMGPVTLSATVKRTRATTDADWTDALRRRMLAPGCEVLSAVAEKVGGRFHKERDSAKLAAFIPAAELDPELKALLTRIGGLGGRDLNPGDAPAVAEQV